MRNYDLLQKQADFRREQDPKFTEYNMILRAANKPESRKLAVYAMCFFCMGGSRDDFPERGYKKHIRECAIKDCPIYDFRPFQKMQKQSPTSMKRTNTRKGPTKGRTKSITSEG